MSERCAERGTRMMRALAARRPTGLTVMNATAVAVSATLPAHIGKEAAAHGVPLVHACENEGDETVATVRRLNRTDCSTDGAG